MSEAIHTSSSLVTVVYSFLLESSSSTRRLLSWHNLLYSSRQARISFSNCDFSDASWSIAASPSAISRLTTNHSSEPIISRRQNNQQKTITLAKQESTQKMQPSTTWFGLVATALVTQTTFLYVQPG